MLIVASNAYSVFIWLASGPRLANEGQGCSLDRDRKQMSVVVFFSGLAIIHNLLDMIIGTLKVYSRRVTSDNA